MIREKLRKVPTFCNADHEQRGFGGTPENRHIIQSSKSEMFITTRESGQSSLSKENHINAFAHVCPLSINCESLPLAEYSVDFKYCCLCGIF